MLVFFLSMIVEPLLYYIKLREVTVVEIWKSNGIELKINKSKSDYDFKNNLLGQNALFLHFH